MLGEAVAHGIRLNQPETQKQLKKIDDAGGQPELGMMHNESKKLGWRIAGIIPRRVFVNDKKRLAWRWPNSAHPRVVPEEASIHESVRDRMNDADARYAPKLPKKYKIVHTKAWDQSGI